MFVKSFLLDCSAKGSPFRKGEPLVPVYAGLFRRLFAEEQPLYALIEEERQDGHQHALEQVERHDGQQHERGQVGDRAVDLRAPWR